MALNNGNQRPGVYSAYTVSSGYSAPRSLRYGAVVAGGDPALAGELLSFATASTAAEALEGDGNRTLLGAVRILLDSGVSRVYVSAVDSDYASAMTLIEGVNGIGAVVTDAESAEDLAAVRQSVAESAKNRRERVAFGGAGDPEVAMELAGALNSERFVLCCPAAAPAGEEAHPLYAASALAGRVLAVGDSAYNWNGAVLEGLAICDRLAEADIQALLPAGVTVLEEGPAGVQCVRAVTTRTRDGGQPDRSLYSLSTVLIIDDVMLSVRTALENRLRGRRITGTSLQSVASQVTVELAAKADEGLLESFEAPRVTTHQEDPSVCVVELGFQVISAVSQIHITAHIQI